MSEELRKAFEDVLIPELAALRTEIAGLASDIGARTSCLTAVIIAQRDAMTAVLCLE